MVENLPVMWETQVQFLSREDLPEKGTATHSSILTWRIPWTEESGRLSPQGHKESDVTERLTQGHQPVYRPNQTTFKTSKTRKTCLSGTLPTNQDIRSPCPQHTVQMRGETIITEAETQALGPAVTGTQRLTSCARLTSALSHSWCC